MESFSPIDRCPDTAALVRHIQETAEEDRTCFSRELHDEMGSLLVSAVMDIAFGEQSRSIDDQLRERLVRVRANLALAIDLKREIIEKLRPSILDNFGLIEALKWVVKHDCARAQMSYTETYPEHAPAFTQEAKIALFRIVQESLQVALRQPSAKAIEIVLRVDPEDLHVAISHYSNYDGDLTLAAKDLFALCLIAHRVQAHGGRMTVTRLDVGGAVYGCTMHLACLTAPTSKDAVEAQ